MMNVDENEMIDCAIDSDENISLLKKLTEMNGIKGLIVQYQLDDPPSMGMQNMFLSLSLLQTFISF